MTAAKVLSSGPARASVMIVGEAPGRNEEREGRPFVGAAGELIRSSCLSIGLDPDQIRWTNICQTRPPNNEIRTFFANDGSPLEPVVEGLLSLRQEIQDVRPNIIIPVGNYPLWALTGRARWGKEGYTGIGDYRGYLLPGYAVAAGTKCLPTYHPAAALRQYPLKHIIRTDLRKAKLHAGSPTLQYPRKLILVDPRGPDRDAWHRWLVSTPGTLSPPIDWSQNRYPYNDAPGESSPLASGDFLSADIEYIGSKLLCVGFTRHRDVAIVFTTGSSPDLRFVRDLLLSGVPLCFQNAMFDCSILEWFYNIPCLRYLHHDTMIAMHAAYIEMPKDLGFIGSVQAEAPPWWQQIDSKFWAGVKAGTRSIDEVLPYNGCDVWVTHEAMENLLNDELLEPRVAKTYRHEMSTIQPLWEISKLGVSVNTERLQTLRDTLSLEAEALSYGIAQLNGGPPVNVKASAQVAEFLYTKMQVSSVGAPRTPTGRFKMDDSTLAAISLRCTNESQRVAIRMVRDSRERLDLVSKFCDIDLDDDGRMRCHYDPSKTVTGRLSSRKFYPTGRGTNLQNVPRDPRVRAVFVPDRGFVFGYADLKSAESLVVAHLTGDREMLRLHSSEYMDGTKDGHKYVASFLLDRPIDRITEDERYLGKRVRHAGNYGMSWLKLMTIVNADAQTTGVSIDAAQAKLLIQKYRQLHPGLAGWWNAIQAELWASHTLYSLHDRKRVFYDRPDAILPEAIAYVPQSTIADTLNMGLLNIAASQELADLGFQSLLQVHDAVGFQVPEANADEALCLLPGLMSISIPINRKGVDPYCITIPLKIQTGYNWGEFDPAHPDLNPNGLRTYHAPAIV